MIIRDIEEALQLKPDALILVDDFDHYPFLAHLGKIYHYEELFREIAGNRRWVLVRLQGQETFDY
ncbi:hypothetical protein [Brevibacillus sp. BC25]|uniref:hypothetical protein n=1 Tax=Brevibacillus sp. BC25 TaxID=1144308 RepID=UPI000270FBFF|nr:hypothetical protein [Brevibacillus sp. BC25]EJL29184.1 hypothetical protein PMI05_01968 [Brevibacillus sp. BC25]